MRDRRWLPPAEHGCYARGGGGCYAQYLLCLPPCVCVGGAGLDHLPAQPGSDCPAAAQPTIACVLLSLSSEITQF